MPNNQQIDAKLAEATKSIVERQMNDGGWARCPDETDATVMATALAGIWLVRYRPDAYLQPILSGLTYLARTQHHAANDGGWGSQLTTQGSDRISTAIATYAAVRYFLWAKDNREVAAIQPEHIAATKKGLGWLKNNVLTIWKPGTRRERVSATEVYWTCLALRESQRVPRFWDPDIAEGISHEAFAFVEEISHPGGGWGDFPGWRAPAFGPTAYCTYLLLKYSENSDAPAARQGLTWVAENFQGMLAPGKQNHVEPVGRAIVTLLEGDTGSRFSRQIEQGIDYLLASYESPHGWRGDPNELPDLVSTQSACRALHEYRQRKPS